MLGTRRYALGLSITVNLFNDVIPPRYIPIADRHDNKSGLHLL